MRFNRFTPAASAVMVAMLSLPPPAGAARPLQTDDAGVLDRADCELEGSGLRQRADAERSSQAGLQLACGMGWKTQLAVAAASARNVGVLSSGLALLGKHRLWEAQGGGEALALSWQLAEARTPGGTWHHEGSELRLIGTRALSDELTLHANMGHAHNVEDRMHSTTWGIALEHAPLHALPGLAPMFEVFGDDRDTTWGSLGLRYAAIADRLSVDASYSRPLKGGSRSLLTVGFKFSF